MMKMFLNLNRLPKNLLADTEIMRLSIIAANIDKMLNACHFSRMRRNSKEFQSMITAKKKLRENRKVVLRELEQKIIIIQNAKKD